MKKSASRRRTSSSGILFVVSAPSGTGKTTIVDRVLKADRKIRRTISHTTRERRPKERNGRDYHFVTKPTFQKMIRQRDFAEYACVYGDYYGTSHRTIQTSLGTDRDAILVIEAKGAQAIRRKYRNAVFVMVLPPSVAELRKRMVARGGTSTVAVRTRLRAARAEVRRMRWYDYVIVNQELSRAVAELRSIIAAERQRLKRHPRTFARFADS